MGKYRWDIRIGSTTYFYSSPLPMALNGLHCGIQAFARRYGGIFNEAGSVRARSKRLAVVLCILIRVEFLNKTENGFHTSIRLQLLCVRLATGFCFGQEVTLGKISPATQARCGVRTLIGPSPIIPQTSDHLPNLSTSFRTRCQ